MNYKVISVFLKIQKSIKKLVVNIYIAQNKFGTRCTQIKFGCFYFFKVSLNIRSKPGSKTLKGLNQSI